MGASVMQRLLDAAGWDAGSLRHKQLEDAIASAGLALVDRAVEPAQQAKHNDLARKAALFREGTKRIYEGQGDRADMWFFELFHFLGDVQSAALTPAEGGRVVTFTHDQIINGIRLDAGSYELRRVDAPKDAGF